jgi:hypothetical protein
MAVYRYQSVPVSVSVLVSILILRKTNSAIPKREQNDTLPEILLISKCPATLPTHVCSMVYNKKQPIIRRRPEASSLPTPLPIGQESLSYHPSSMVDTHPHPSPFWTSMQELQSRTSIEDFPPRTELNLGRPLARIALYKVWASPCRDGMAGRNRFLA